MIGSAPGGTPAAPPDVAIFLPSLAGGGAERMMVNLARGLAAEDLVVDLVAASATGPYRTLVSPACNLVDLGAERVLTALPGLVRYLRRRRPRVLIAAMDHANLVALWAQALARVPTRVYVSVRSNLLEEARTAPTLAGRAIPWLIRHFYPGADGVIAVSQGVADVLGGVIGSGRANLMVLPNPVVTPELGALAAQTPDHPWLRDPQRPVILAAGRLTEEKDFATLIRAFAFAVACAGRDLRLIILGEGPRRAALEALARDLGIADRVALPGFTDNPFAAMRRARLFALSSAWEGLPGVLIQAMACGTPVVSTDCPSGPREILEDGRLGPLVPVGDVQALAGAMLRMLEDPTPPERLQARAADYALAPVTRRYCEVMGLAAPAGGRR